MLCNVCVCGDVTGSVLWLAAHQTDWGTVTPVQSTVWLAVQPTNGAPGCQWQQRWTRLPQQTHDERSLWDYVRMLYVRLCPRDLMLLLVTLVTLVTLLHFRGFCFREHQVVRHFFCAFYTLFLVFLSLCVLWVTTLSSVMFRTKIILVALPLCTTTEPCTSNISKHLRCRLLVLIQGVLQKSA